MNMKKWYPCLLVFGVALVLSGCDRSDSSGGGSESESKSSVAEPSASVSLEAVWRSSMVPKNQAGLDRLSQTDLQRACSNAQDMVADEASRESLRKAAEASVKYPVDGQYLGDWQRGEAIANDGKGMQWSDDPAKPNGGNCYACHELSSKEIAYGTIGPSLRNYGQRGQSEAMLKYTWAKIWNPNAYLLCSHMPRFGDAGILNEQQIRDVMAFLLDPASPVNNQ